MSDRSPPYRERVPACIHPETYKYFLERERVGDTWSALEARYGRIEMKSAFRMMEISGEHLWLRSVVGGNPITVLRKRTFTQEMLDELHELLGYEQAERS